jgi:hypothetical protein
MKRILWAFGGAAVLALTALAPAASATTISNNTVLTPPALAKAATAGPVTLVTLGASFSPSKLKVPTGQLIIVTVDDTVNARVAGLTPGSAVGGGELGHSRTFLYVATTRGTATINAVVGPHCKAGHACPQWIATPKLMVTVTR